MRSNSYKSNIVHINHIFKENEELVVPLLARCSRFKIILSFVIEDRIGFQVKKIDWTKEMKDWGELECKCVGRSLATFLWKRKMSEVAVDAWRKHYAQLNVLFTEIERFDKFMELIANSTLRDSVYGTVYRVAVGAALSMIDAATDIYVLPDRRAQKPSKRPISNDMHEHILPTNYRVWTIPEEELSSEAEGSIDLSHIPTSCR